MTEQKEYGNPYRFMEEEGVPVMDPSADINGTCLQGCLYMDYEKLCEVLGPPNWGATSDHKIDIMWIGWIGEEKGQPFTVYNWKSGPAYLGTDGTPIQWIKDWHVGGKSYDVFTALDEYISKKLEGEHHG